MDLSVNYFVPEHPVVPLTVRNLLRERYSELSTQLQHARDWPDFMNRIGEMKGVAYAIEACEDVEKNLNR